MAFPTPFLVFVPFQNGTFKVFANLSEVFEEKRLYHRDKKGHIVKKRDDLLSAIRYAYMMARFSVPNVSKKPRVNAIIPSQTTHWS